MWSAWGVLMTKNLLSFGSGIEPKAAVAHQSDSVKQMRIGGVATKTECSFKLWLSVGGLLKLENICVGSDVTADHKQRSNSCEARIPMVFISFFFTPVCSGRPTHCPMSVGIKMWPTIFSSGCLVDSSLYIVINIVLRQYLAKTMVCFDNLFP